MSLKTSNKSAVSLSVAAVLVALVVAASFGAFRQIESVVEARNKSVALILKADELLSDLVDAETSQRGYALTGDEAFLQPYLALRDGVGGHLQALRPLTLTGEGLVHLDALAPLVEAEMAEMEQIIVLRRNQGMDAVVATVRSGRGKRLMDSIRVEVRSFVRIEQAALARHEEAFRVNMRNLFVIIIIATLFALLFAFAFSWLVYRETQHRLKSTIYLDTKQLLERQEETNKQLWLANVALQDSEKKLAVTLNSIGDAVIATDADGRVTRLNPLAERLTGWKQENAVGRPVNEVFNIINQETRKPSVVPVTETLAKGTIQGLANHTILVAKGGSECIIADSCAPIRNHEDAVIGAVLVFRDVTEEYAAQQALRDSAALIQAVLNTVGEGIVTLHARGGIIETVNPAAERMFGYAAGELIGSHFSLLIPELDSDQRNGSLEYYGATDEARAAGVGREVAGRRKDGSILPLEIAVSEMWLGGKRYFTGIFRDISVRQGVETERNEALSAAKKASTAKTDFLSSMSHELRTPLNAILGFAQLIDSGSPLPTPAQKRNLDHILKAGWYLLELINEILDLALIESGRVTVSREPVSLFEVMLDSRSMVEAQAKKRGVRMSFPRVETPYFVNADRLRLKQIMINLLFNAIKYNKPEGTVNVEFVLVPPSSIRISVRDTGMGLTAVQLGHLFEPFNRLGKEASEEEGTGIGLVVTRRLITLMGGIMGVESTVGEGSTFWIELSLIHAPQHAQATEETRTLSPAQSGAPARTVLYVEDNPANLELVEQLLARRSDLRLLTATDGDLGIQFARTYQPEVILMDINLPGISGLEAMKILRADPLTAHIPIVAISANAVANDIERAIAAGFFRYLTKPIQVNAFMDTLDIALEVSETATDRVAEPT